MSAIILRIKPSNQEYFPDIPNNLLHVSDSEKEVPLEHKHLIDKVDTCFLLKNRVL